MSERGDRGLAVGSGLLDHLEDVLRAGRPHGDDHDPVRPQLLQERRRDVVDAAGDDDLVERRRLGPAEIAVGAAGRDVGIFAVSRGDQPVVDATGARRELRNDLDRVDARGEVGEQRRLVSGAGADLEHLLAVAHLERTGHPAHRAGRGDGHAEADVDIMPDISLVLVLGPGEFLAGGQQEGALLGRRVEVVERQHVLVAVEAALKVDRVLAGVGLAPGDEGGLVVERRRHVAGERGRPQSAAKRRGRRRADQKIASPNHTAHWSFRGFDGPASAKFVARA